MAGTKSNSGGVRNINAKGFVSFSSSFFKILILYTHTISYHCSSIEFKKFGFGFLLLKVMNAWLGWVLCHEKGRHSEPSRSLS